MVATEDKYEIIYKMLNDMLLEEGIHVFETIIIKTVAVFIETTILNYVNGIIPAAQQKPTYEELQKAAKICNEVLLPKVVYVDSSLNICDALEIK